MERKIKAPDHQVKLNITQMIEEVIAESGFSEGHVVIQTKHTTTGLLMEDEEKDVVALLVQEDERGLMHDLLEVLERLVPQDQYYEHDDFIKRTENIGPDERKNAASHLKASFLKESVTLTFEGGQLSKGTWQSVLFFDFDAAGRPPRTLVIQVCGYKENH